MTANAAQYSRQITRNNGTVIRSAGFRMTQAGDIVGWVPQRALACVSILLCGILALALGKAALLGALGGADYHAALIQLQAGGFVDRIAAALMGLDSLTLVFFSLVF